MIQKVQVCYIIRENTPGIGGDYIWGGPGLTKATALHSVVDNVHRQCAENLMLY